jgi:hypothetical protein
MSRLGSLRPAQGPKSKPSETLRILRISQNIPYSTHKLGFRRVSGLAGIRNLAEPPFFLFCRIRLGGWPTSESVGFNAKLFKI